MIKKLNMNRKEANGTHLTMTTGKPELKEDREYNQLCIKNRNQWKQPFIAKLERGGEIWI